ncbi:prephenate dehydratase domain-containing protein [Buchnera aphidicola]|uniref:Bifunctional chorismate mutase/prephenate dehydratase n=1 Tax=Buchnera aphidicola (Cinara laricifoliae) TaxID=2518977 RepID=A0A451DBG2_9GAMM|nr:prephenate dehydratase domain-containing protein [Buchnera aphidicola]VFP83738.1 P-protein [Buchnera aphidicola (Cinara laricifoliae)]
MDKKQKLTFLRNKIDYIDYKIIKLLSSRESVSINILKNKIHNQFDVRDKNREMEIFYNLHQFSKKNKINPIFIKKIFKIIVENSVIIQKNYKNEILKNKKKSLCAYLGPIGSYSSAIFNSISENKKQFLIPDEHYTFDSIIKSLENNNCDIALLPIENRISGIIPEVYDILKKHKNIYIIKEFYAKIQHHLFANKNCFFYKINQVYSHIQPFKQCSLFIKKFPEWNKKYFNSTSAGMKQLALENQQTSAAIGNSIGGSYYNLKKIAINISNINNNITRFILISKKIKKINENISNKITIIIKIINYKINKYKILKKFKRRKIKIIKMILVNKIFNTIEATYFIEIKSYLHSEIFQEILSEIKKYTKYIKILGCYPIEKNITKLY